jgi:hypothetical protein
MLIGSNGHRGASGIRSFKRYYTNINIAQMRRIKPHFFPLSQRSRFIAHVPLRENQQRQSQFKILTRYSTYAPSALRRSLKE